MNFYSFIILLEILSINTYTTYSCSNKKKPPLITILSVCTFTAIFSILLFLIYRRIPTNGTFNGKGLFMLFGFFYVIPLKYLFDQSMKRMLIIMSSSWIYTMFTFALSVQIGYLFPLEQLVMTVCIVQTILYMLTIPFYIKFINRIFVYILRHIENRMINSLFKISLSWFFIIFLLNYFFVEDSTTPLKFIMLFIIIWNSILSYKMLYNFVYTNNRAETLSQITKIDTLTQLKNREGLYEDVLVKTDHNIPFAIIFIDLDDFKSINDNYGHAVGDTYLIEFAKSVNNLLTKKDCFYRLHGDEFIILTEISELDSLCSRIQELNFVILPGNVTFLGLSLGSATFPADGDKLSDLMYIADSRMYQVKKEKRRN